MALVVEDGTGLSNAESYASVAEGDSYWDLRGGSSSWDSASTSEKEAALRYATEWVDVNFTFKSAIYSTSQSLNFPRTTFYDTEGREITGIPTKLKNAVCEVAVVHLDDKLNSSDERGSLIVSEKVGSSSVTYNKAYNKNASLTYVNGLLEEFGYKGGKSYETFRA